MTEYTLVGVDGNAFAVMGYVMRAMKECGFGKEELDAYQKDATGGDYNNLLAVSAGYVDRCNERRKG